MFDVILMKTKSAIYSIRSVDARLFHTGCGVCTAPSSLNSTGPFSARHPRDILARMSATNRACRACPTTSPSSLLRAYLIGRPAVCCGVVLPVCPCVVLFSEVHEHDTQYLLRTCSRGRHEDAIRGKLVPWNSSLRHRIRCESDAARR